MSAEQPTESELRAIETAAKAIFGTLTTLPYPSHAANALSIASVLLLETANDPSGDSVERARSIATEMGDAVFNMWSARNNNA